MIVEQNQSNIDLSILGYGSDEAMFELADSNVSYSSTIQNPYTTREFPHDFEVGEEITINEDSQSFLSEPIKTLNRTKLKLASKCPD